MNKIIRDGKVAVLYSPGYGAGWYTWNMQYPEILFDPSIVTFVEKEEWDKCNAYLELKYPDIYTGGSDDLQIKWIPEGTKFIINEYDGNESIQTLESTNWLTA
jgi:hypothetical protein